MVAIQSRWDEKDDNLYLVKCDMGWTWLQFVTASDDAYAMLGKLDHDVNFAMWFKSLPPGEAQKHMSHAGGTQPPNIRHTVIINNSTRFLDILVKNADRQQGWVGPKIVTTIEDARAYLSTLD